MKKSFNLEEALKWASNSKEEFTNLRTCSEGFIKRITESGKVRLITQGNKNE